MTEPLPPVERRGIILEYAAVWKSKTFIETGTADGETTWNLAGSFRDLHTIELNQDLYRAAVERFKPCPMVHCWWGDSATVLPVVLREVKGQALLWLDGHYSGIGPNPNGPDTPIREELEVLFQDARRHVILIDDARVFREGDNWDENEYDYPTLTEVRRLAHQAGYQYELADDIIRLTP